MRRLAAVIAFPLVFATFQPDLSHAAASKLTISLKQTPGGAEPVVTLYGLLKPARSGIKVSIQIQLQGQWQATRFSAKTTRVGTWQVVAVATALNASVKYRASATISGKKIYSGAKVIKVRELPGFSKSTSLVEIDQLGPGGRIHGADISRWQHPNDEPIDFEKMYSAGVRFLMIKASDTRDDSDKLALKYVVMDRSAAQAAGIFTGFYHYTILPDVKTDAEVILDAQAQAQKVLWRLASLGGYNEKDLPYALDLENKCVRLSGSTCARYLPNSQITLWAKTFLRIIKTKTGRTPILYSYPSFLEGSMVRDEELSKYPLWLAQYAINPADPLAQPGLKSGGCYVHSWTAANCSSTWTIWQYTSCGIAPKYGVPGSRLDLNVFRGTPSIFRDLLKGTWIPDEIDLMPKKEPTSLVYQNLIARNSAKAVSVEVDVARPDGSPVVTGTVRFIVNPETPIEPKPIQKVVRSTSGSWTLKIKGIPAGVWSGEIRFTDATGTHARSKEAVEFTVEEAPFIEPSPTPTAKPTIAPTKKPAVDTCKNQIKN